MFTQAQRGRLKRDIADILEDHGLPPYLKVDRLADLFEDRSIGRVLRIPDFEALQDGNPPPENLPTKKKSARKKAAGQRPAGRKNTQSTGPVVSASEKG